MLTIVPLTFPVCTIRKTVFMISGVLLLSINGFAQGFSALWNTQISISPYNLHAPEGQITMVGTDEDGKTVFCSMTTDGTGITYSPMPEVSLLGSSLYDSGEDCYYVMGANENIDKMQLVKYQANGTAIWQKNLPFSGFRFPYQIVKLGNQIAFVFGQLSLQGVSTGFGWWLLDPSGQILSEKVQSIPPANSPVLPYAATFAPSGNLVIATSNLSSGEGKVYALDPVSGVLSWSSTLTLPMLSTIQSLYADASNEVFLTGEYGFFARLSASGDIVFQKELSYAPVSAAYKILEKNGFLYLVGGWRESVNTIETNARVLVAKCNPTDGSESWIWTYEHTGVEDGPVATNGVFTNDSTLILNFSRGFSSEWVGAFHLNGISPTLEPDIKPLLLSPNPSTDGMFSLQGQLQTGRLRVYNSHGRLIIDEIHQPGAALQLPEKGIFWIQFEVAGQLFSGKIVFIP